jgi:hypothetical protein
MREELCIIVCRKNEVKEVKEEASVVVRRFEISGVPEKPANRKILFFFYAALGWLIGTLLGTSAGRLPYKIPKP